MTTEKDPTVEERVKAYLAEIPEPAPDFKNMSKKRLIRCIETYTGVEYRPLTVPDPHQLVCLAFACWNPRAFLFVAMRLGKTKISLDWAQLLRDSGAWRGKGIVIAHAPIGLDVWESEAAKHSKLNVRIVRRKLQEFEDALNSDADLIVTPWSGIQATFTEKRLNRKKQNALYPDFSLLEQTAPHFDLAIIDEIHRAQDPFSLWTKCAISLLNSCDFRLGLTGTPFGRNGFHLWSQTFLLDDGEALGKNYLFFQRAFGNKPVKMRRTCRTLITFSRRKLPLLRQKLAHMFISYEFKEVRTVREQKRVVRLRMRGDQLKHYNQALADAEKQRQMLADPDTETLQMENTFLRLRRIAAGHVPFVDEAGTKLLMHTQSNAKLDWFKETVKEWDGQTATVVFFNYRATGEDLSAFLTKQKIPHHLLYGGTKDTAKVVRDFEEGRIKWLLANGVKGGTAIDLTAADTEIFYESPVDPKTRKQAEARPFGRERGDRKLIIEDVVCAPVDLRVLGFIAEGTNMMEEFRKPAKRGKRRSLADMLGGFAS